MADPADSFIAGPDPFAAAIEQRKQKGFLDGDDPFAAEITRRKNATVGNAVRDVGFQLPGGVLDGVDLLINAPYNLVRGAGMLVGHDPGPAMPKLGQFKPGEHVSRAVASVANEYLPEAMQGGVPQESRTDVGRYAHAVGTAVGSSVVPGGTILGTANRAAALAPTTLPRAFAQSVGQQVARAPGAAVAADLVASTGSGLAQQGAEDAGGGPLAQTAAAVTGAIAPAAVMSAVQTPVRAIRSARVNASPEGRMLRSLEGGDATLDDLATGIATGESAQHARVARRTFDILGEEMVRSGGDRASAVQATLGRLQSQYGLSQSGARDAVRRITQSQADNELFLGEYPAVMRSNEATRRMQPQNITDEAAGAIDDVPIQREIDRIANAGNTPSAATVTNAVNDRLPELRQQFRERLQDMAPGQQTIQDVENMLVAGRRSMRMDYDAAHTPGQTNYGLLHGMLPRIVERHLQRMAGRSDDVAGALDEAIGRLYTTRPAGAALTPGHIPGLEDQLAAARQTVREMRRQKAPKQLVDDASRQAEQLAEDLRLARREGRPTEQQVLMPSLQMLQDMRGGIRGQITAARQAGRADQVAVLQPLYRDITRAMARSNPRWAQANRRWANMELEEVGAELGDAFALQAGPRFRQQLQDFRRMAPEAQDVVRVHFVQKLMDKIENNPDTHDLAKLFATPHIKQMVRTVLGDAAAVSLNRTVRDNRVATKTKGMLAGSQTAKRQAAQRADDTDLGILAAVEQANLSTLRKLLVDWTIGIIKERRNRGMARDVTMPVRDTAGVAEIIQRMRGVQTQRRNQRPLNQLLSPAATGTAPFSANED